MEPHITNVANAAKIWTWLNERGGLAIWESINLSNLGATWTTPANDKDGEPTKKPTWQAGETPRIITDPAEVLVSIDREVKRFRVGIRLGSQGMTYKVTDGGSRRIRKEVAKAGKNAYHLFDYETQEAVIMASDKTVPIAEYISAHPVDFEVQNEGTIFLLHPKTQAALDWAKEHLPEDVQRFGEAYVVEHRYIQNIVDGAKNDGLTVE